MLQQVIPCYHSWLSNARAHFAEERRPANRPTIAFGQSTFGGGESPASRVLTTRKHRLDGPAAVPVRSPPVCVQLGDSGGVLRSAPGMGLVLNCPCPAVLRVTRGDETVAIPLHFGQVLFISAGSLLSLETVSDPVLVTFRDGPRRRQLPGRARRMSATEQAIPDSYVQWKHVGLGDVRLGSGPGRYSPERQQCSSTCSL